MTYTNTHWKLVEADVFWGDLAFHDHVFQVYENDELYIEALTSFVGTGLHLGDGCIIFVTQPHLESLNSQLRSRGIDVDAMIAADRFIPLDAQETISKFLVNGMPDEGLLAQALSEPIQKCRDAKRLIRAGGEMSALLTAQGNTAAALALERLSNKLMAKDPFIIFCACSKSIFAGAEAHEGHMCAEHSKMISGSERQSTKIRYTENVLA